MGVFPYQFGKGVSEVCMSEGLVSVESTDYKVGFESLPSSSRFLERLVHQCDEICRRVDRHI